MHRRFGQFLTVWLVAQILLPFTAPFPTCDLSDFFGGARHHSVPLAPQPTHIPQADAAYTDAPPLATTAGRLKLVVVQALDASGSVAPILPVVVVRDLLLVFGVDQESQVQQTVLRL
jgi:hypothetical protein